MSVVRLSMEPSGRRWAVKHNGGTLGYASTKTEAWSLIEGLVARPEENLGIKTQSPTRYRQLFRSVHQQSMTILVVENEAIIRLELVSRIAEMGLTPLAASNADEAIAILESHPEIELVVTDIKMPGGAMDGLRLAHCVRERWPPVKIIVVSGLLGVDHSQLPPSSMFLTKPCAPEVLMDALAHLINGKA